MREFCAVRRDSGSTPLVVFEKGMFPKFVDMEFPVLVDLLTAVISRKPNGVR